MRFSGKTWLIGGLLYTTYIAYGTLLPFDFSFSLEMIKNGLGDIEWIERYGRHFYPSKSVDTIANFMFFLPLGIIIYNIRYAFGHRRRAILTIIIAAIFGLLLSTSIEFLQLLIEARRTSYIDVISNTLGCLSGAVIAAILPLILTTSNITRLKHFFSTLPAYLVFIPLLLSGLLLTDSLALYFLRSEKVGKAVFNWQYIIQPLWIWRLLFFYIPLGLFSARLCRNRCRIKSLRRLHLASFTIAGIIFICVALAKSVFLGDAILAADFVFGFIGILMGLAISEIIGNRLYGGIIISRTHYLQVLSVLLLFFTLLIFYKFAYPFQLNYEAARVVDKSIFFLLSTYSFIPFIGILKLVIYSLQNIILFFPIGILIMEIDTGMRSPHKGVFLILLSAALVLCPVLIQFFNNYQTPFMYQIPTNALGLFLGNTLWYGLKRDPVFQ